MDDGLNCTDKSYLVAIDSTEKDMMENTMKCKPGISCVLTSESREGEGVRKSQKVEAILQNETYVYRQDVVRCIKQDDMLGVVLEVPGDSDSEDSIADDSDIEDSENDNAVVTDHANEVKGGGVLDTDTNDGSDSSDKKDPLSVGEVRIMWLDGTETTNNLSDLVVVDRSFLHGDIVASIANPTGQLGLVVDVHITVDLLSSTGESIKDVSSLELTRIKRFTIGDYVVQGPWLGRIEDVLDNVTVLFDDGSVCKVLKADPLRLKPVCRSIVDDTGFPYYPGQRVRASSSSVFKNSRFISGSWKANRLEGTVTKVEAGSVFIYWISSSSLGIGANPATVPPEQQNPKKLTLVSCFAHANWQLGEWCLFSPYPLALSSSNNTSKIVDGSIDNCNLKLAGRNEDVIYNSADKMVCCLDIHNQYVDCNAQQDLDPGKGCEADELQNTSTQNYLNPHTVVDHSTDSLPEESLEEEESLDENCQPLTCASINNPTGIGSCASSSQKESIRENRPIHRKKLRKVSVKMENKGHRKDGTFEKAFLIVNTITKVDVAWQDGTRELGLNSNSLIPINSPGDQDFFPEQYVIEKVSNEGDDSFEVKRVGVVKSVNATERTACVRWLKPVSRPEDPREFDIEEVASVYELDEHPDYDYCYGDVVIRLAPMVVSSGISLSGDSVEEGNDYISSTLENEVNCRNSGPTAGQLSNDGTEKVMDLSWVGHITGLQDGDIEVTWADGMISKVGPQAIFVVGRDDDETSDDGSEWGTVEENDADALDTVEEESDMLPQTDKTVDKGVETSEEDDKGDDPARSGPLSSAFGFVARLTSGLFSHGKNQADLPDSEKEENKLGFHELVTFENATKLGHCNFEKYGTSMDDHGSQACGVSAVNEYSLVPETTSAKVSMSKNYRDHTLDDTGAESIGANEDGFFFKHFDITKDPLDHYFLGGTGQATVDKKWAKKVQQEWNILEKNLPDAIYVRVFEDRIDLLRAAIIGACGTPYQDGLFFFDFQLPSEYPQDPPKTYYHSGGLRINPNLYEDGKVCLSLLNTWTGKGNEVWDPSSSSILQVLVSLQGLVLNSMPYFNEAGYEKQIGTVEGEKNCLPYNENTFLLNLKSMMYLLRRPPMHFEEFIKDHFQRRGHYILRACDAYMKGSIVGSLTKDADIIEESNKHSCSVGFRLMLAKILPRLFTALAEVGVECNQYEHLLGS